MTGYTPLFESLTTGTLCGRWPDVGLWPIVLSLADRMGVVDVTPDYLSRITGLGLEEVRACMSRFCAPDPGSRSTEAGGARLILLDPENRDWGWRITNHSKYREKARLIAKSTREVVEGKNKARMGDRRRPPVTAGDHPSNSNSNSNKDTKRGKRLSPLPSEFVLTAEMRQKVLAKYPDADPEAMFDAFRNHHLAKGAESASWPHSWGTWVSRAAQYGYPKMQPTTRRWQ